MTANITSIQLPDLIGTTVASGAKIMERTFCTSSPRMNRRDSLNWFVACCASCFMLGINKQHRFFFGRAAESKAAYPSHPASYLLLSLSFLSWSTPPPILEHGRATFQ